MKRVIAAVGILILVFGVLLVSFTFTSFPEKKIEAYQIPKSTAIVNQHGLLGPFPDSSPTTDFAEGGFNFSSGELLNIQVNVTSDQKVDFYVSDGSKGLSSNVGSSPYLSYLNVTLMNTTWIVPENSTYNFVFNSPSKFVPNDVYWQVVNLWNETNNRTVTENVHLLPFPILYVGVGIVLSGFAVTIYGTGFRMYIVPKWLLNRFSLPLAQKQPSSNGVFSQFS